MSTPRFLVSAEHLDGTKALLRGAELHHLRVRRLRAGSAVVLMDGRGRERSGIVAEVAAKQAVIALSPEESDSATEPSLTLKLAMALIKADKLDLVIEKATELGVSDVILYSSRRCVAKPRRDRLPRWQRIAESAAKQSQRARVPTVHAPVTYDQLLQASPDDTRLLFWERAAPSDSSPVIEPPIATCVLAAVGPEGGLTADEGDAARRAGFHILGLGPRILRAETAAIAAIVLCQSRWGDLKLDRLPLAADHARS